jgi:hypothetical protein
VTLSSEEQRVFAELTSGLHGDARPRARRLAFLSVALLVFGAILLTATFTWSLLLGCLGYLAMLQGALLGARAWPTLRTRPGPVRTAGLRTARRRP